LKPVSLTPTMSQYPAAHSQQNNYASYPQPQQQQQYVQQPQYMPPQAQYMQAPQGAVIVAPVVSDVRCLDGYCHDYEGEFTACGVCLGIFFFPIGLLCCLALREQVS
jgi:hypothetical protein